MRSRTSFFNGAALRKDITRFAPVWGLYSVFLLLALITLRSDPGAWSFRNAMVGLASRGGFTVFNLVYGGICAALLFGDLFSPRMSNMLHSLPMRREGWFFTHVTAGILFSFVPNLLYACVAMLLGSEFYLALIWLAIMMLTYLFYFGVGCISALCAGKRFAMLTVYGIINFFSMLVYLLARTIYNPLFYGFTIDGSVFQFFCPVGQLSDANYFETTSRLVYGAYQTQLGEPFWGTWIYTFAIAGLGLVCMALALWAYRRRALERAGDFIAIRPLAPVFLVIYTLAVGAIMFSLDELMSERLQYVFLAVGLVVGFFTGKMMLERTVKVFRPKALLGFVVLVAVLFASLGLVRLDPLNIVGHIPDTGEIASIEISTPSMDTPNIFHGDRYSSPLSGVYQLTEPEDIETIRAIHKTILQERPEENYDTFTLYLTYHLKNGSTVHRRYPVKLYSDTGKTLQGYFSDWRYVFQTNADWETFVGRIRACGIQSDAVTQKIPELMEAIRKDCENGNLVQDWSFHRYEEYEYWVSIDYTTDTGETATVDLRAFTGCTELMKFIKETLP